MEIKELQRLLVDHERHWASRPYAHRTDSLSHGLQAALAEYEAAK
jgi:hypothetical protein